MSLAGLCRSEGPQRESSSKRCAPQFRHRRVPFPELPCLELILLDLLRQLDSANGDCRVVESFQSQHRPKPLCHAPVVLFDQVVQVLARSDQHSLGEFACRLPFPDCAMRGSLGVQRDLRRFAPVLHCMAEKGLGRIHSAISTQQEVHAPPGFVHSPIQVDPASANPYLCLAHPPGSAHWTSVSAPALLQFRHITLDPSQHRCGRERAASIRHHNPYVPQTQFETRVPANAEDDDLPIEHVVP